MGNYEIIWSPIARISYLNILEYLRENWPEIVIEQFIFRTEEVLNYIGKNPHLYAYSTEMDAYKCVVVKQVSLFYKIKNNSAELLVFWDNRQKPDKLLLFI